MHCTGDIEKNFTSVEAEKSIDADTTMTMIVQDIAVACFPQDINPRADHSDDESGALEVLTIIGVVLSLIGVTLTIITLLAFK